MYRNELECSKFIELLYVYETHTVSINIRFSLKTK